MSKLACLAAAILTFGGLPEQATAGPRVAWSKKFGVHYTIVSYISRGYGRIYVVKLLSTPPSRSPIAKLRLRSGDYIKRLDGLTVGRFGAMEKHVGNTDVLFVRNGSNLVSTIFISRTRWFREPCRCRERRNDDFVGY